MSKINHRITILSYFLKEIHQYKPKEKAKGVDSGFSGQSLGVRTDETRHC